MGTYLMSQSIAAASAEISSRESALRASARASSMVAMPSAMVVCTSMGGSVSTAAPTMRGRRYSPRMLPYEVRDGVHVMFLQPNPEKPRGGVVVLDAWLIGEIKAALTRIAAEKPKGFVLASASTRVFVAGADLAEIDALDDAGLSPGDVGYVNAHGTSTQANDSNETSAIKASLGERANQIPVSSTKSMTGHLLGGAGGLESVFTVLAVHHQVSPPTINIFNQDPECDLDYCANTARDMRIDVAIKNNFGFGGTNGTLIFQRI